MFKLEIELMVKLKVKFKKMKPKLERLSKFKLRPELNTVEF